MGQTITEKIFARHAGLEEVRPGQLVNARVDKILSHDITTTPAINLLKKHGLQVFDPDRVIITLDHFVPSKDIASANMVKKIRDWTREVGLENFYDIGSHGVCHAIMPEQGHVLPGEVIVGADSHTCTYGALGCFSTGIGSTDLAAAMALGELWFRVPETIKIECKGKLQKGVYSKDIILRVIQDIGCDGALYNAMEWSGSAISQLSMEARMTITNMAIEAGGKSAIIEADEKTFEYVRERVKGRRHRDFTPAHSDADAEYCNILKYDFSELEPTVAWPHLPSNGHPVGESAHIKIDQAYLGSCTNGRIEDLRIAAQILNGNTVNKDVRMVVVPASTQIWNQALKEGLFEIFTQAGATISTPTCGACLGGHMGVLGDGEVCITSTNRNFKGRMGHHGAMPYLASPATVAASAIAGRIADPRDYL